MADLGDSWLIEFHSGIPVYRQIMHHIQAAIASGALKQDERLPTIRALHKKLGVNPNTVAKAFRDLELAGVISTQRGSGSFIAAPKATHAPSVREKKARLVELTARVAAQARSYGVPLEKLVEQLIQRKEHV